MAEILYQIREEASRTALESGTAGVGGLEIRELGYTEAEQEFSFRNAAGAFRHIPTRQRLALAAAAVSSGASAIGYFPSGGLVSTNIQDAIDELAAGGGGGGGGGLGGGGVAGRVAYWTGAAALDDVPFLDIVSGKLQFNADADATLFLAAAGTIGTDGNLSAAGYLIANTLQSLGGGAEILGTLYAYDDSVLGYNVDWDNAALDGVASALVLAALSKNNANTRTFMGLHALITLNAGGSNNNTTVDVLSADTVNTGLTGVTVNLLNLKYGGSPRLRVDSAGRVISSVAEQVIRMNDDASQMFLCGGDNTSSSDGAMILLAGVGHATNAGKLRLFPGTGATIDMMGPTHYNFHQTLYALVSTPSAPAADQSNLYMRGTYLVFQYDDGGTARYKYLDLAGTGTTWVHSTTAP